MILLTSYRTIKCCKNIKQKRTFIHILIKKMINFWLRYIDINWIICICFQFGLILTKIETIPNFGILKTHNYSAYRISKHLYYDMYFSIIYYLSLNLKIGSQSLELNVETMTKEVSVSCSTLGQPDNVSVPVLRARFSKF